jgi:hypothetical protein
VYVLPRFVGNDLVAGRVRLVGVADQRAHEQVVGDAEPVTEILAGRIAVVGEPERRLPADVQRAA